jgi:peptidoglycan/LPS O-acetylase OafA/YrhL
MTFKWNYAGPEHFWSLAVEEHFYLFWPLLVYFFDQKKIVFVIIAIIILAFITRIVLVKNDFEVFYFTFSRIDELCIGAILAILEIKGTLVSKNSTKFLILFFLTIIPSLIVWSVYSGKGGQLVPISKFLFLSFSYLSLLGYIITLNKNHRLKKILSLGFMSYTGKISYGLYVYHPLCFYLFNTYFATGNIVFNFILSFVFAYVISSISYYFFEAKFLSLKKYFNYS